MYWYLFHVNDTHAYLNITYLTKSKNNENTAEKKREATIKCDLLNMYNIQVKVWQIFAIIYNLKCGIWAWKKWNWQNRVGNKGHCPD